MAGDNPTERLSSISTRWSMLFQAHAGPSGEAAAAVQALMQRYCGAVYRYLLGAVHDPDVADDLAQEFALRFLRGDFRRADAGRGRFRDYLRTALTHLVHDHQRARQHWPRPLAAGGPEPAAAVGDEGDPEREFLNAWREELLERTWKALAEANPTAHAVLRLRLDNPDLPSPQMAERLTADLGKPVNAAWVRKTLQRAHDRFADLLLEEVARSLLVPTPENLRRELEELELLGHCRAALARWGR
jgi:RNA polymerase sigma-70 factor (ECF subfamily)